jgi:hypothetical protein
MEIGAGIALSSVAVAAGGVAITAIRTFNGSGRKGNGPQAHCLEHSGICAQIEGIHQKLEVLRTIEDKLDRVLERRTVPRD